MEKPFSFALAQPFTFSGVAGLAVARSKRLRFFRFVTAAMAAAAMLALFELRWVPVIRLTIDALPASGAVEGGELHWPDGRPLVSQGSSFLWISIDPTDLLEAGEGADFQLEFGRKAFRCRSLFGFLEFRYLPGYRIALNQAEADAWWGAWHPFVSGGIVFGAIAGLYLAWRVLALLYAIPVRFLAFYADRECSIAGASRIGSGCLLPGAWFFIGAILAYTFNRLNLVQLLLAAVLHIPIAWAYAAGASFCLPRQVATVSPDKVFANPLEPPKPKSRNPFSGSGS